jgi:ribose transport system permease protein
MTVETVVAEDESQAPGTPKRTGRGWPSALSFNNVGALYVLAAQIVIFSLWTPEVFPTLSTARQILDNNAIIGLAALSIVVPLCAGVYDLSFAYTMSLSGVTTAFLVDRYDVNLGLAMAAAILVSLFVGFINATVVVTLRVESLIATLATGSLIVAFINMVTDDAPITSGRLAGAFTAIGQTSVLGGITLPVLYLFAVAAVVWYFLEHMPVGRRLYAAGFNPEAARLAGIPVRRLRYRSLLVSAVMAGFTGIVLASYLGSGSPSAGTPYLLTAFAAAFLGATQFKHGRFNAWGTVASVLMLGTGITGLALAAAPAWAANMFTGVVLIAALAYPEGQRLQLRGLAGRVASRLRGRGGAQA